MKCLSKPTAFLVVAACLALTFIGSSNVQQVNARVFRHDAAKKSNSIRMQKADHIALRERYYAIRYHGANVDDESTAAEEDTAPDVLEPSRAPSILESAVRRVTSTILRFFGSQDDEASSSIQSKKLEEIASTLTNEVKPQVPQATPKSQSRRTGKLCIAGMCGLNLAFASLSVTFVACFVVVYFMDRYLHNKRLRDDFGKKKEKSEETKRPETVHTAAVVRRSSVSTTRKKASTTAHDGIRARIFNYYQDVAEMSSLMLRQRPPLGI